MSFPWNVSGPLDSTASNGRRGDGHVDILLLNKTVYFLIVIMYVFFFRFVTVTLATYFYFSGGNRKPDRTWITRGEKNVQALCPGTVKLQFKGLKHVVFIMAMCRACFIIVMIMIMILFHFSFLNLKTKLLYAFRLTSLLCVLYQ